MVHRRSQILQQIVKGGGLLFFGQISSFVIGFFFQLLIARYLGVEEFGMISLGIVLMSTGITLVQLGLPAAFNRFVSYYSAKNDIPRVKGTIFSGLNILAVSSGVVVSIGLLSSQFLADVLFHSSDAVSLVNIFILAIPLAVLVRDLVQLCIGFKRPLPAVFIDVILHGALRLLLVIIALYFGVTVFGIGVVYFGGLLIAVLAGIPIINRIFPDLFSKTPAKKNYREMLTFSLPLFFASSMGMIMERVDSLMIGFFISPADVGIYRIAFAFAAFLGAFRLSFNLFFLPVMTQFYAKKEFKMIRHTYGALSRLIFLLGLPSALLFIVFPSQIIMMLFGNEYGTGGAVLMILAMGSLVSLIFGPGEAALQAAGETKVQFKIQAFAMILNVVLNFFLIQILGIRGAAISTAVNMVLISFFYYQYARKSTSVQLDIQAYAKYIFAGLIAIGALYFAFSFIEVNKLVILVAGFSVFFFAYFALLLLLNAFDKDELNLISAIEGKVGLKSHPVSRFIRHK